ncbi:MAG TPA: hypothetical protein VJ813_16185 [Vicinamibacterales bacterium]|nr:hypothetical protein [Vicinamibacterales bacterium]
MQTHVKVLAVLFIVFSALGVLAALGMMAVFGSAAGIVGATAEGEEAAIAIPIIGITGSFLVIFLLAVSLPGLIAGFGLLSFRPWARILGIVLCAIQLIHIPLGTIFGAYGLWVLLNKESERMFEERPASA